MTGRLLWKSASCVLWDGWLFFTLWMLCESSVRTTSSIFDIPVHRACTTQLWARFCYLNPNQVVWSKSHLPKNNDMQKNHWKVSHWKMGALNGKLCQASYDTSGCRTRFQRPNKAICMVNKGDFHYITTYEPVFPVFRCFLSIIFRHDVNRPAFNKFFKIQIQAFLCRRGIVNFGAWSKRKSHRQEGLLVYTEKKSKQNTMCHHLDPLTKYVLRFGTYRVFSV